MGGVVTLVAVYALLNIAAALLMFSSYEKRQRHSTKKRAKTDKGSSRRSADQVDVEAGVLPGKVSKNQRRKIRRLRMPRVLWFPMARYEEESDADEDDQSEMDPFQLDDASWLMDKQHAHFIGDESPNDLGTHATIVDSFALSDDAWKSPLVCTV